MPLIISTIVEQKNRREFFDVKSFCTATFIQEIIFLRSYMSKLFFSSLVLAINLFGAQSSCPQFYLNGEMPDIVNEKLNPKTKELCFEAFGVMHSGISKTPLWSAEYLTRENLEVKLSRKDVFHEESRLKRGERAELSDYAHNGGSLDRGHMSPSADFATPSAQAESFTLANMIPQDHENNTGIWSDIESASRYLAKKEGSTYVITGPIFSRNIKAIGFNNVLVPSHIYKIIYSIKQNKAAAYVVENAPGRKYQTMSVKELESYAGINFFPKMKDAEKSEILALPEPKRNH